MMKNLRKSVSGSRGPQSMRAHQEPVQRPPPRASPRIPLVTSGVTTGMCSCSCSTAQTRNVFDTQLCGAPLIQRRARRVTWQGRLFFLRIYFHWVRQKVSHTVQRGLLAARAGARAPATARWAAAAGGVRAAPRLVAPPPSPSALVVAAVLFPHAVLPHHPCRGHPRPGAPPPRSRPRRRPPPRPRR